MEDDDFEFGEDGEEAFEALGPMMVRWATMVAAAGGWICQGLGVLGALLSLDKSQALLSQ